MLANMRNLLHIRFIQFALLSIKYPFNSRMEANLQIEGGSLREFQLFHIHAAKRCGLETLRLHFSALHDTLFGS